ncbi:AAA family ATPase [Ensifer sp. B1-9]|uniref:AAA family ATPase n=1 Tax=Ensifer sp. B1-9 TaxID=3141455 RepID=UPI003D1C34E2
MLKNRKPNTSRWLTAGQSITNLPIVVAGCAMQSMTNQLLKGSAEPCVVVAIVPEYSHAMLYKEAASGLLECAGLLKPNGRFDVEILPDTSRGIGQLISTIEDCHSVFFIATDEAAITPEVNLLVDVVETLATPQPQDYLAAGKVLALPEMTEEAATFLASQNLGRVRLASRSGRPLAQILERLKESPDPSASKTQIQTKGPMLQDMAGYGDAQTWGLRLAADLAAWKRNEIGWCDVDRGILLEGPPGCGKTSFARALANTCGVELVPASFAQWQACGHLGDFLEAMRKSFELARKKKPCILFLDELDSFSTRRPKSASDNADYQRQAINGLLERLDPVGGREGVVVVGATNDASIIDPAIVRPGRLERIIRIELPDADSRRAILLGYLENCEPGSLEEFVASTSGWTGAQIEKFARDIRRMARHEGRPVGKSDIEALLPKRLMLTSDKKHRLAVHEAGHAIVAVALGKSVQKVRITDHVLEGYEGPIGETVFASDSNQFQRAEDFQNSITVMLGGIAAERLLLGDHASGAGGQHSSDLVRATDLATLMERYFAYGDSLETDLGTGDRPLEWLRLSDPDLRIKVELRLRAGMERATAVLSDARGPLEALVVDLVSNHVASGETVVQLLAKGNQRRTSARRQRSVNRRPRAGRSDQATDRGCSP